MSESLALRARLRALEDEREILRTLQVYGAAIDAGDEDGYRELWADDAVLDWPNWGEPMRGRGAIMDAFARHTHAPETHHRHVVFGTLIALEGETARVESQFLRIDDGANGPHVRSFGTYHDELVRSADGRWRFRRRQAEIAAAGG
jgi:ketosteroid isomerase-like protein